MSCAADYLPLSFPLSSQHRRLKAYIKRASKKALFTTRLITVINPKKLLSDRAPLLNHSYDFATRAQTLLLIALVAERITAQIQEIDTGDLFEDEEDDEPEPIAKRQFNAVRDTFRNTWNNALRFVSSGRIIRGLTQAIAAVRPANNNAVSSTTGSGSGNAIGNAFRNMRTAWARRSAAQQGQFRKRLADITRRITNNRIIIGGLGNLHKLSGRSDDAKEVKPEVKSEVKTETKYVPVIPQFVPVPIIPYPQPMPAHPMW